jgi:hypothetical protein
LELPCKPLKHVQFNFAIYYPAMVLLYFFSWITVLFFLLLMLNFCLVLVISLFLKIHKPFMVSLLLTLNFQARTFTL